MKLPSVSVFARPFLAAVVLAVAAHGAETGGWVVATKKPDLTVYERPRKGTDLLEYKAVGTFAAPPATVKRVLDDVEEYPHFMPYVVEARVISRDASSRVSYQRISPPIVGDRDYTVRVSMETRKGADGPCFCNRWESANEQGPPEKPGVARVKLTEGSWLLEPVDGGRQTRATYSVFSDSGAKLPAMVLNAASRTAIPSVFEGVRKQVQLPKYRE